MPSGRNQVAYEGIRYDAITKKIDNSTITFDATKANGSAAVGKAVTPVTGTADTVALAADANRITGKLLKVEADGFCTVQDSGFVSLPAGDGATVTPGQPIVGDLGPGGAGDRGYIRNANSAVAAETLVARGEIHNVEDTTKVWVDLG
jgi:hypothetical protein